MSTDFYLACNRCIKKIEHIHAEIDSPVVAHRWYGGKDIGSQINFGGNLEDTDILISEYGEPHTVAELKAEIGAGKLIFDEEEE